jgi:hypothetical protein
MLSPTFRSFTVSCERLELVGGAALVLDADPAVVRSMATIGPAVVSRPRFEAA